MRPLAIIRDEHRSLAAVIHGLEYHRARGARPRQAAVVPAAARDRALRPRVSRGAAPSRRKTRTSSRACARARPSTTRRSTSSSASTSREPRSSKRSTQAVDAYEADPASGLPLFADAVAAFRHRADGAHDARGQGDHSRGAQASHRRRLDRRSPTRSARTATRASPSTRTRSTASCSRASSISRPTAWSAAERSHDYFRTRGEAHHHAFRLTRIPNRMRRRATAMRPCRAVRGAGARVRDRTSAIPTSRCAGTTRSATTSAAACNRRTRRSSAPSTTTTATATSATARSSPTASTSCPSSTVVWQKSYGARVSAALWYDNAYSQPRQHQQRRPPTRSSTACRSRACCRRTQALSRRDRRASGSTRSRFANFETLGMQWNVKAGQHTVYWGDSLLLGGAVHGVSYAQNSLDLMKGFGTPGAEAKELFRPKGGITLQTQATKDLSIAGQWFYNWQAVRVPESGSYLTANDALQFGGDSTIFGAEPVRGVDSRRAGVHAPVEPASDVPPSRYSASLGDWGISARWSPDWLDGTLGFYYRNATDILPQTIALPGFAALPAATCTAIGGIVVTPNACIINPKVTNVADLTQKGKVGEYRTAYGNNIHIMGVTLSKNIARRQRRRRALVPAEHAAAERPVSALPTPLREPRRGPDLDQQHPDRTARRARSATRTTASSTRCTPRQDAAVRHRVAPGRAHLDALGEGHAERGSVQGPRQLHRDRQAVARLRRPRVQHHADLVPGAAGRRPARADLVFARPERQRRRVPGRQRRRRQLLRSASPPTSTRSTGSTSSTPATSATTRPTRPRAPPPCSTAFTRRSSDRGWCLAHVQDHVLRRTIMFRKTLIALAVRIARDARASPRSPPTKRSNSAPRSPPSAPKRPPTRTARSPSTRAG